MARNACFCPVWSVNCPIIALIVLVLALDTSSPAGSIAVLRGEKVIGVIATATDETYSSRMFRQLEFLLAEVKLSLEAFDLFAVNSGPGSFTGLRVGLTAAKGWSEVYGKPVVGVSGLETVATQSHAAGTLVPVLDARRGQVYFGFYGREGERLVRKGEDRVGTPEEFLAALKERPGTIVTPDPGLGTLLTSRSNGGSNAFDEVSCVLAPVIARIAIGRAERGETSDALTLDANYVRRSDAELFWKGPRVLRIRRLESRDVQAILTIQSACPEIAQWSARAYERVAGAEMAAWVAEDERGVAGFLVVRMLVRETEILNFAVRADVRRRGIGTKLIGVAVEWSRGLHAEKVTLEVRASNEGAIGFYERHGFVVAGRRPKYYAAPVEDALLLSLQLTGRAKE